MVPLHYTFIWVNENIRWICLTESGSVIWEDSLHHLIHSHMICGVHTNIIACFDPRYRISGRMEEKDTSSRDCDLLNQRPSGKQLTLGREVATWPIFMFFPQSIIISFKLLFKFIQIAMFEYSSQTPFPAHTDRFTLCFNLSGRWLFRRLYRFW